MATRAKMDRTDRAKQFMPFAALKGYEEALRERDRIVVEKIDLSEDRKEELDRKLQSIRKNDMVTVIYFFQGEYLQVTGLVSRLDADARILQIVNTRIGLDDIYEIELENKN